MPTERNGSRAIGLGGVHVRLALLEPRAEDRRLDGVFARAAVIDEIEVAVFELGHAGRVLVRAGRDLGAEDASDRQLAGIQHAVRRPS